MKRPDIDDSCNEWIDYVDHQDKLLDHCKEVIRAQRQEIKELWSTNLRQENSDLLNKIKDLELMITLLTPLEDTP